MTMVAVGFLDVVLFLTNSSTESSSQHYLRHVSIPQYLI
jgi:hypothetical protein